MTEEEKEKLKYQKRREKLEQRRKEREEKYLKDGKKKFRRRRTKSEMEADEMMANQQPKSKVRKWKSMGGKFGTIFLIF